MKISINKDNSKLHLENANKKCIDFALFDPKTIEAIDAYLKKQKLESLDFKLRTVSSGAHRIQFSTGYEILIPSSTAFEIANRMILLNKALAYPEVYDDPEDYGFSVVVEKDTD